MRAVTILVGMKTDNLTPNEVRRAVKCPDLVT
ncbi:unnamed protein product [Haemonchus placei]|uniref:3-keto-5-aminohexanoate cleavage protein n=1 Tax=Haemonchus placei TaxID=6290 RepID=A0A0N4WIB2_HAEPC|nr:unnamed protein product [Haemonchus placei]